MTTITVCQRKGGNGKSTSSLNLAHAFALSGLRVLVIDLDDQKNTTSAIATEQQPSHTIEQLFLDASVRVADVALSTEWAGVSLVAATSSLSGVIRELDGDVGSHLALKEKLASAEDRFDICLIDTSPSLNILVVNALVASRYAFIPLSSRYFSLQGLGQTLESVTKIRERLNGELSVLGIAFVIHDGRSALAKEVIGKENEEYPAHMCKTLIAQNIHIEEAQILRKSIFAYAPVDRGAAQYRALADELLSRMGR
jgi:chromosome partitioning protein